MRLFLLPISNKRALIYCKRLNQQLTSEQTYVEKVTSRASTTWVKWEGAKSGWQKQLTGWGNQLFKRIPYEEWGLKSIPPLSARRAVKDGDGEGDTEVIYPSSIIKPGKVLDVLQKLATERQALHRKWMWGSIIGMPVTLPFGLIPILPNIPFFYLAFRAWSHWRALSGSQHVEYLLKQGLIKPVPSSPLSSFYALQALNECEVLVQEYDELISQRKYNDALLAQQEFLKKHWKLIAKCRAIVRAHDEFCTDYSEPWEAGEEKETGGQVTRHNVLRAYVHILLRPVPNEALTADSETHMEDLDEQLLLSADSETHMEDLDEQMLLSAGRGAKIAKVLEKYEGASELVVEVDRAIEQVQKSLLAQAELKSEKEELESATTTVTKDVESK